MDEDWWPDYSFFSDPEDRSERFREYRVSMTSLGSQNVVLISVYAVGFDEALTCGEVLSAVYFG